MGKTIENIHKIFNFIYNVTVNLCEIEKAMVWHLNRNEFLWEIIVLVRVDLRLFINEVIFSFTGELGSSS